MRLFRDTYFNRRHSTLGFKQEDIRYGLLIISNGATWVHSTVTLLIRSDR